MAEQEKTSDRSKPTEQWERENTDPTVPFDGALPENIPGPASNVEAELAANKRAAAYGELSTRYRPEHAKQAAKTGDAVTDSDVIANPAAGLEVADDNGAKARAEQQTAVAGTDVPPQGRTTPARRGQQQA